MKSLYPVLTFAVLTASTATFAAAPVEDLNQQQGGAVSLPYNANSASDAGDSTPDTSNLPMEQRVKVLEQQVANITQMNLSSRLDNLEQQIQQLNGQIEVQTHNIAQLTEQQKSFYQDLDQRLTALKSSADKVTTDKTNPEKTTVTAAVTPKTASPDEEKAYQTAFNLLVKKQNDQAATAFEKFLKDYPNGKYAGNSHYWLGEIYSSQNKTDAAATEFNTLITQFPDNSKKADAMLKLAVIHDKQGQHTQAKQELQKIIKQYPGTSTARLANLRLQQMKIQTPTS